MADCDFLAFVKNLKTLFQSGCVGGRVKPPMHVRAKRPFLGFLKFFVLGDQILKQSDLGIGDMVINAGYQGSKAQYSSDFSELTRRREILPVSSGKKHDLSVNIWFGLVKTDIRRYSEACFFRYV